MELNGKAALITGGTDIAGAVSLTLAKAGVNVCLCGMQDDLLHMYADRVRESGGTCFTHLSALASLEDAQAAAEFTTASFGRLDILIMVSPFWSGGEIHSHSVQTWDLVMNANLRGPFLISRAVLPLLRAQGSGQIMAIGSDSALGYYASDGAFGVAMHGLTALMEQVRAENSGHGIRTHILSPGVTLTTELDSEGQPALTAEHVAEWAWWLLTQPEPVRGNGPIRI